MISSLTHDLHKPPFTKSHWTQFINLWTSFLKSSCFFVSIKIAFPIFKSWTKPYSFIGFLQEITFETFIVNFCSLFPFFSFLQVALLFKPFHWQFILMIYFTICVCDLFVCVWFVCVIYVCVCVCVICVRDLCVCVFDLYVCVWFIC